MIDRRRFLGVTAVIGLSTARTTEGVGAEADPPAARPLLTNAGEFFNVKITEATEFDLMGTKE